MFDKEYCADLLAKYGAERFSFGRDGVLYAVVGTQMFVCEGEHIEFGASDAQLAQDAIDKAKAPA